MGRCMRDGLGIAPVSMYGGDLSAAINSGRGVLVDQVVTITSYLQFSVPTVLYFDPNGKIVCSGVSAAMEFDGVPVQMHGPRFEGAGGAEIAVAFVGCAGVGIVGGKVSGFSKSGLRFSKTAGAACSDVSVQGSSFDDIGSAGAAGHGAIMFGTDGGSAPHTDISVLGCRMTNIKHIGIGVDGPSKRVSISHNSINKTVLSGEGIAVGGGTGGAQDVTIADNECQMPVGSSPGSILVYQSCNGVQVTGNRVRGGSTGIYVDFANPHAIQRLKIEDNYIADCANGILLNNGSGLSGSTVAVFIGRNMFTNVSLTPIERSTIAVADKAGIVSDIQILNGALWMPSGTGFGDVRISGLTAARPPVPFVGQNYFDTNIGRPVWWDGGSWLTAAGAAV